MQEQQKPALTIARQLIVNATQDINANVENLVAIYAVYSYETGVVEYSYRYRNTTINERADAIAIMSYAEMKEDYPLECHCDPIDYLIETIKHVPVGVIPKECVLFPSPLGSSSKNSIAIIDFSYLKEGKVKSNVIGASKCSSMIPSPDGLYSVPVCNFGVKGIDGTYELKGSMDAIIALTSSRKPLYGIYRVPGSYIDDVKTAFLTNIADIAVQFDDFYLTRDTEDETKATLYGVVKPFGPMAHTFEEILKNQDEMEFALRCSCQTNHVSGKPIRTVTEFMAFDLLAPEYNVCVPKNDYAIKKVSSKHVLDCVRKVDGNPVFSYDIEVSIDHKGQASVF